MCYRQEWLHGWMQDEVASKRAELKSKRKRAQSTKPAPRPGESRKPSKPQVEARIEEIV